MPKKSDRPEHESAMSNLLPEVSLDEEDSDESKAANEESNSSTELQNSSAKEEENYSGTGSEAERSESESAVQRESSRTSDRAPGAQPRKDSGEDDGVTRENEDDRLPVLPNERPDLKKKLGPYVSEEVDDALEEVYLTLRRRFGGEASKSLIVEAALRYSLSDCLRRREESEIASWMERVLESKES
jgi:hypothetical protein